MGLIKKGIKSIRNEPAVEQKAAADAWCLPEPDFAVPQASLLVIQQSGLQPSWARYHKRQRKQWNTSREVLISVRCQLGLLVAYSSFPLAFAATRCEPGSSLPAGT